MIAERWAFPTKAYCGNLAGKFVTDETIERAIGSLCESAGKSRAPLVSKHIGSSRAGRPLHGLTIGNGSRHVSITAGAHADEPTGPMTAIALAEWLVSDNDHARHWTKACTWRICPQINPDGAQANRQWFADPVEPMTYWKSVVREQPGDDIEFGYPGDGYEALRPENAAVAEFLRESSPYAFHASLHAMAVAEGAWFLIGQDWLEESQPLQRRLAILASEAGFALHDIDRQGDKGFFRIARGFCTTPTSAGMRQHFLARDDRATADLFRLSSMEYVRSLGGDPLVMVSEMPLMLVGRGSSEADVSADRPAPALGSTEHERFRVALGAHRADSASGEHELRELASRFHLRPIALADHVQLQGLMVLEALAFLEGRNWSR